MDINPNNAEAHFALGYIFRYTGPPDESVQEMEKAITLDPNNTAFRSILLTYLAVGEYEKIVNACSNFEQTPYTIDLLGDAHFFLGNKEQAILLYDKVIAMEPEGMPAQMAICVKAVIEGNRQEGLEAAHRVEEANMSDAEAWYYLAGKYSLLGDNEGCIRCLQRAVDSGYFNYPVMNSDPFFESVREDEEFQIILQNAKVKHLAFKERFF